MIGGWGLRQSFEGDEGRGGGSSRQGLNHGMLRAGSPPPHIPAKGCLQGNGMLRCAWKAEGKGPPTGGCLQGSCELRSALNKEQTSCRMESRLGKAGSRGVTSEPIAFIQTRGGVHLD